MVSAMREQEEAAREKDRKKQELKQQRLDEMKLVLDSQILQRKQRKQQNQLDWVLQGKIWKEEAVVAQEEESRKQEAQRQKRRNLDLALKMQVAGTLDEEQRLLPHLQKHARAVNQAAFRVMAADGFAGAEEFLMAKS